MCHYNEVTLQHRFNQQHNGELQLECRGVFVTDCKYEFNQQYIGEFQLECGGVFVTVCKHEKLDYI